MLAVFNARSVHSSGSRRSIFHSICGGTSRGQTQICINNDTVLVTPIVSYRSFKSPFRRSRYLGGGVGGKSRDYEILKHVSVIKDRL